MLLKKSCVLFHRFCCLHALNCNSVWFKIFMQVLFNFLNCFEFSCKFKMCEQDFLLLHRHCGIYLRSCGFAPKTTKGFVKRKKNRQKKNFSRLFLHKTCKLACVKLYFSFAHFLPVFLQKLPANSRQQFIRL